MKGIIFDLDGTLLDTVPDLLWSINAALSELGYETITDVKLKSFIGNGAKNLVKRCIGKEADDKDVEELLGVYRKIYSENLYVRTKEYDGIHVVLSALADNGVKLAVLSNKPDDQTVKIISHFFPDIPFACVRGKVDGVPLKPDPFSALEIARVMELTPEEILFVGDSPVDFQTAQNAGMKCVSVLWGYRDRKDYEGLSQNLFISFPRELLSEFKLV